MDQQVQVEGEEEGEDPRWELVRQFVEYKKFKDAAARLQVLEAGRKTFFRACPANSNLNPPRRRPPEVSIFDLLNAVNGVLQRFSKREDPGAIFEDKWISEKIEFILRMIAERGSLRFAKLFESAASRSEVICTFLALLELIRLRQSSARNPNLSAKSKSASPNQRRLERRSLPRRSSARCRPGDLTGRKTEPGKKGRGG